jgi:arginyl-tRNA synthetase
MPHTSFANVLDAIDSVLARRGLTDKVNVVTPQAPSAIDLTLVGRPDLWRRGDNGDAPIDEVAARPEIAAIEIRRKQRRATVRIEPSWLAALGAALERGDVSAMPLDDLAGGSTIVLDFCDPNATKALHIGHLRNLALGQAFTSLAAAAGAKVVTQSQVGDMGRSMGETLAGYVMYRDAESPAAAGLKSDHFVGDCYSRYVARMAQTSGVTSRLATDPALSREDMDHNDLAEELLTRWAAGESEVTKLWRKLRSWAMDGQDETLQRLGVNFDRLLFESDFVSQIEAFAERAVAAGAAERAANGAIGYRTGQEEYPYLLLQRADGQTTQHLRYTVLWEETASLMEGWSLQIMGKEWLALSQHSDDMLIRLNPDADIHPTKCVIHGMLATDHGLVKSSGGTPWLIDELLDDLVDHSAVASLCGEHGRVSTDQAAAMIALGSCLGHPATEPMTMRRGQLLDPEHNPGWAIARAWVEALDPIWDGAPDPEPDDADYRFLTVQSQLHRRFVALGLQRLDLLPILRYHTHLSRWFLETTRTPRLARIMRTVVGLGREALGLCGPPVPGRADSRALQRTG